MVNELMAVELHVIRASDFVRFDADQHLNFEESKRVLEELALACRKRGLDRAMVDLRDLPVPDKPRFTAAELALMVGAFCAAGFSGRHRLAILYRQDVYGTIRSFSSIGQMRGLHVQAFDDYDTAMHWLWKPTGKPAECKPGAEVPIVRKGPTKRAANLTAKRHRNTTPAPDPVRTLKRGRT